MGGLFALCIYIHSIGPFSIRRLIGLIPFILESQQQISHNPSDHITTKQVRSPFELPDFLDWVVKLIKQSHNTCRHIRLIVIDSIANIFTSHFDNSADGVESRNELLRAIGYGLHSIVVTYNVVVLVNNVVDVFPSDRDSATNFMMSYGRKVCPALGVACTRNITTRLFMSKSFNSVTHIMSRSLYVLFSSSLELGHVILP